MDAGDGDPQGDRDGGRNDAGPDAPQSFCAAPCVAPLAVCDETTRQCVECTADKHDACTPGSDKEVCLTGGNTCVGCNSSSECSADKPFCDPTSHQCRACVADTDAVDDGVDNECAHLSGTPACFEGTCVECTMNKRAACPATAHGNAVCDPQTHQCTDDIEPGQTQPCSPCASDAQCTADHVCAAMRFANQDVGNYCQPLRKTSCASQRPYAKPVTDRPSVDGNTNAYCSLNFSTCEAIRQEGAGYRAACGLDDQGNLVSSGATRGDNDRCGAPDFDDGFCVQTEPGVYKCTVPCGLKTDAQNPGAPDCPDVAGGNDPVCALTLHAGGVSELACTL